MKKNINTSGYSTIIVLIITGFLLVMVVGIFNLVLRELQENRSLGNAIKAFAGAESAQEMALLNIKNHGYGFYKKMDFSTSGESSVLITNPENGTYHQQKDPIVSYDLASKTLEYEGLLEAQQYHIIPLFYIDEAGVMHSIGSLAGLTVSGADEENDLVWNVISQNGGISGLGTSTSGVKKEITTSTEDYLSFSSSQDRNAYIGSHPGSYLVLYNSSITTSFNYEVSSNDYFTKPVTHIISSAIVGENRQNLSTRLDNTQYLGMLKYAIFSK